MNSPAKGRRSVGAAERRRRAPQWRTSKGDAPLKERVQAVYREAILDGAEAVFTRHGLQDVKMAAIAAQVGASVGTLYNYFSSKDEVFAALISRGRERFFDAAESKLRDVEDPVAQLRVLAATVFEFVHEHGALFNLYLRSGGDVAAELAGDAEARRSRERFQALVSDILERGVRQGGIRKDIPVATLTLMLGALLDGFATLAMVQPESADLESAGNTVVDVFLEGAGSR